MRFKDILLENVVLNATKPLMVSGEQAQAVQALGLENSLEDWAHKRYSKWIIQVKEAKQVKQVVDSLQPGCQHWNQVNQFVTNEKIHTQKKYKSDCKKYCKSEVEKYESISVKI